MLNAIGYGDDEINAVLATGSANIALKSNRPFYLNDAAEPAGSIEEILRPDVQRFAQEPPRREDDGVPHIRIWHDPPSTDELPSLTEAETQRLGSYAIADEPGA